MTRMVLLGAVACAAIACGSSQARSERTAPAASNAAATSGAVSDRSSIVAPAAEPSGPVTFKAARDLKQHPEGGEPQLRGGQEADSADWPASLYVTFKTARGTASCTAALIGPTAMLTAGHCVPSNGAVTFVYEGHRAPYAASCTRHPRYSASSSDPSADFGLCTVSPAFAAPAGFQYETVNTSAMSTLLNQTVILSGYGCVSDIVANDRVDGKCRIGFNAIDETSDSHAPHRRDASFYAPAEVNNLFTTDDQNRANLCPGDSG